MWIEGIFIESFGGSKGLHVDGLGPGMTVILGPNEAGKSTVLEFVRSIFFGFRKRSGRSDINTYETIDGAPRRGWLLVNTGNRGGVRVERTEQSGRKEGALSIRDPEGNLLDPSSLPIFRLGMERSAYEGLYAFDLDTMRGLDQESLRGKIFGAALGSLEVNPSDIVKQVNQRLKILEKKSPKDDRCLFAVSSQLADLSRDLRALKEKPALYAQLKYEFSVVGDRKKEIAVDTKEKESALKTLNRIIGQEEAWRKLLSLDRRIAALQDAREFPTDGLLRLEKLLERRRQCADSEQELTHEIANLREELLSLNPDETILEHANSIFSLDRQAQSLANRPSEMESLRAQISQAGKNLDEEIAALGLGWTRQRIALFDPSLPLDATIGGFADSWAAGRAKIQVLYFNLNTAEEACVRFKEKTASKEKVLKELEPLCSGFLSPEHRNLLWEWREHHARVRNLRERLADRNTMLQKLESDRRELQQSYQTLYEASESSRSWMGFLGVALPLGLIGAVLLALGYRMSDLTTRLLFSLGIAAVIAALASAAWKIAKRKMDIEDSLVQRTALTQRIARIDEDMAAVTREQAELVTNINMITGDLRKTAGEVLGEPDADLPDILASESRSLQAEKAVRRKQAEEDSFKTSADELAEAERRKRELERSLEYAKKDFVALEDSWKAFLKEKGLDSDLEPETARQLVHRLSSVKKELRNLRELEERLTRLTEEWEAFVENVRDLGLRMGRIRDDSVSPIELTTQWTGAERETRETLIGRKAVAARVQELETRLELEQKKLHHVDDEVAALMEAAGVVDKDAFREKARHHEEYETARREQEVSVDNLIAGLACPDEESVRRVMEAQDWQANKDLAARLQADLEDLAAESDELANRSGRLSHEIEALEAEEETEKLLAKKEALIARLNEGTREWVTLKLAASLLEKTISMYESEKQPKVMARTSEIFKAITGGAFERVRVPMDGNSIRVERSDGSTLDQRLLSRGTLEQLYLALRLAHVEVYHGDDFKVPLLMDDTLVNFDLDRGRRTAEVLATFSEETGIQILFFTCHPHTADLFPKSVLRSKL